MSSTQISFKPASVSNLDDILHIERNWDEGSRAAPEKFLARLQRFPEGFFIGYISAHSAENAVATVTSMPIAFKRDSLEAFPCWADVTNNGYLFENIDSSCCNALYIVSGIIDRKYRGQHVFEAGVMEQVKLALSMGMRYIVAGAVIPGYKRYCEEHGETDAYEYCTTRRGRHLVDPLLAMYEKIGFHLTERHHVVPEYFPDENSRNYAAIVVRDLEKTPL